MSKIITVDEVLQEMQANHKDGTVNRFNKKNFEKLMLAMMNDPNFATEVAKAKGDELDTVEKLEVSQNFRKFIKKVVEKFGVDKAESAKLLTDEFTFDNAGGLYEFLSTAMYVYMKAGNRFDMLPKEDFRGSLAIKRVDKTTKTSASHHPQTREFLGNFEVTKEAHDVLTAKSTCPKWLRKRKKVN